MTSRTGSRTAALAAALGMAACGLIGCSAPSSPGPMGAGQPHAISPSEPAPPTSVAPDRHAGQPSDRVRRIEVTRGSNAYSGLCRCPQPVHYSDIEIKAISAALRALPDDNPLQQAMSDYENERDNLRICLGR
jgi:hypothetical protein